MKTTRRRDFKGWIYVEVMEFIWLCTKVNFLLNLYETNQKLPYKINLPGYEPYPFYVHPNTLELFMRHFQTPKDQSYLKLTQEFEKFDISKPQKCPILNQIIPLCRLFIDPIYYDLELYLLWALMTQTSGPK